MGVASLGYALGVESVGSGGVEDMGCAVDPRPPGVLTACMYSVLSPPALLLRRDGSAPHDQTRRAQNPSELDKRAADAGARCTRCRDPPNGALSTLGAHVVGTEAPRAVVVRG